MKFNAEYIKKILKENSLRVTQSRLDVADIFIEDQDSYFTPEEVFQSIKSKKIKCDQVSVYRILTKFEELGILKKSEFHNDASRYSVKKVNGKKHHHEHYFKCLKCDTVEPFSDCFMSKKEKELEANGYRNLSHHIEITGLCPTCA